MTKERVSQLQEVNFQWKLLEDWIVRFRELQGYKQKHGDTLVPQQYSVNPSLGIWVRNQRTQYKHFMEGKPSKLSLERIRMLESLDFEWNAYDAKWMASYVELGKYMREHGLGRLPPYYKNDPTRKWADQQRKQYRKFALGLPLADGEQSHGNNHASCASTQKRVDLLNLLAFPWTLTPSTSGRSNYDGRDVKAVENSDKDTSDLSPVKSEDGMEENDNLLLSSNQSSGTGCREEETIDDITDGEQKPNKTTIAGKRKREPGP